MTRIDVRIALERGIGYRILNNDNDVLYTLLGNVELNLDRRVKIHFLTIVCKYIRLMYRRAIKEREGIG